MKNAHKTQLEKSVSLSNWELAAAPTTDLSDAPPSASSLRSRPRTRDPDTPRGVHRSHDLVEEHQIPRLLQVRFGRTREPDFGSRCFVFFCSFFSRARVVAARCGHAGASSTVIRRLELFCIRKPIRMIDGSLSQYLSCFRETSSLRKVFSTCILLMFLSSSSVLREPICFLS